VGNFVFVVEVHLKLTILTGCGFILMYSVTWPPDHDEMSLLLGTVRGRMGKGRKSHETVHFLAIWRSVLIDHMRRFIVQKEEQGVGITFESEPELVLDELHSIFLVNWTRRCSFRDIRERRSYWRSWWSIVMRLLNYT
jgi:hypothetical protein